MKRFSKINGFTLIEVLVALIILAIVGLAVMKTLRDSIYDTDRVQEGFIANQVAINVLNNMQIGLQDNPSNGSTVSGSDIMLGQTWSWQASVAQAGSDFYERVSIDVSKNQQRIAHLEGFVPKGKKE